MQEARQFKRVGEATQLARLALVCVVSPLMERVFLLANGNTRTAQASSLTETQPVVPSPTTQAVATIALSEATVEKL